MTTKLALIAASLAFGISALQAADATELYTKNCAPCHGKDGKGQTTMGKRVGAKDYTDPKTWEGWDDAKAFKSVKEGMKEGDKEKMKPFAEKLSDDEIKSAIGHLKTFKP